jgi:hypothetical protein
MFASLSQLAAACEWQNGESVSKVMRRIREAVVDAAKKTGNKSPLGDVAAHDRRRTVATYLGNRARLKGIA